MFSAHINHPFCKFGNIWSHFPLYLSIWDLYESEVCRKSFVAHAESCSMLTAIPEANALLVSQILGGKVMKLCMDSFYHVKCPSMLN
jgi:hypothetical protein